MKKNAKYHKKIASGNTTQVLSPTVKEAQGGQPLQTQLPPLIKRQVPEGQSYSIVIPENVERIIRKFCAKAPDNEWSGTLFFEFEGNFNSPSFKIICKDFFLMDLGSSTFTSFDEDGTAMDYMCQHPELLNCQMGLTHSHDRMPTFFSGTDTSTLQKEGYGRNNFVSLIVNNEGTYSAAITRKVEYTEKHYIEMSGKYPFFGTRQTFEVPANSATEEKTRTVIEWFDLTVEKATVEPQIDEYELRFNEVKDKTAKSPVAGKGNSFYYGGYGNRFSGYYGSYGNYRRDFDDDEVYVSPNKKYPSTQRIEDLPAAKEVKDEVFIQGDLFSDIEPFDDELIPLAVSTPAIQTDLNILMLKIITGCPVICKWVKPYEIGKKTFDSVLEEFEESTQFNYKTYSAFVFDTISNLFPLLDGEDYFPKQVVEDETYAVYRFEDIVLIKLLMIANTFSDGPMKEAVIDAIKEYFNIS